SFALTSASKASMHRRRSSCASSRLHPCSTSRASASVFAAIVLSCVDSASSSRPSSNETPRATVARTIKQKPTNIAPSRPDRIGLVVASHGPRGYPTLVYPVPHEGIEALVAPPSGRGGPLLPSLRVHHRGAASSL